MLIHGLPEELWGLICQGMFPSELLVIARVSSPLRAFIKREVQKLEEKTRVGAIEDMRWARPPPTIGALAEYLSLVCLGRERLKPSGSWNDTGIADCMLLFPSSTPPPVFVVAFSGYRRYLARGVIRGPLVPKYLLRVTARPHKKTLKPWLIIRDSRLLIPLPSSVSIDEWTELTTKSPKSMELATKSTESLKSTPESTK
jgi:hypothetical protein